MKRDMDLVRQILLNIEAAPCGRIWIDLDVPGFTDAEISYHVMLLAQAGLVDAVDCSAGPKLAWKATNLRWAGHEFLEAARDDTRWAKAKSIVLSKSGGMVLDVLKEVLVGLMKRAVFS